MNPLIDTITGEVASPELVEAYALEYAMLAEAIELREAEQRHDRGTLGRMREELLQVLEPGEAVNVGPVTVVRTPAPRPAQRVSRSGCEHWAEQLHALGLGEYRYQPPGIAEIRKNAARILAAGIQLEAVAPTPSPAADTLQIVPKPEG